MLCILMGTVAEWRLLMRCMLVWLLLDHVLIERRYTCTLVLAAIAAVLMWCVMCVVDRTGSVTTATVSITTATVSITTVSITTVVQGKVVQVVHVPNRKVIKFSTTCF